MIEPNPYFRDTYDIVQKDKVSRVMIGDKEDIKNLIEELKELVAERTA